MHRPEEKVPERRVGSKPVEFISSRWWFEGGGGGDDGEVKGCCPSER
jgi:hypothetical protein